MIGILTFHRSHNYGSVLQAYALQQWLDIHNYQNEIIDLYTMESKQIYQISASLHKGILKSLFFLFVYRRRKQRWDKFFSFQNNMLHLSRDQYSTFEEMLKIQKIYTSYITGSDQIWNTSCYDFNWSYYLAFLSDKSNKIAYAPSFGPIGNDEQQKNIYGVIKEKLKQYHFISVREKGSADFVEKITGERPSITVDPTFLLTKEEWETFTPKKSNLKIPKHYIFFYSLKHKHNEYKIVKYIANQLQLPIVITNVETKRDLRGFKWIIEAGPLDFLFLIQHADLVLTSSFHGTAFSIIFEKLFYSINGNYDNRISSLLNKLNISDRVVNVENYQSVIDQGHEIKYDYVKRLLKAEIHHSEEFLYKALESEKNGNLSS